MADISFNIARKELKIAQIAQLYQLFRLSHLFHIYGHGFCELSRMLMRKNVNNDVSKDSPIRGLLLYNNVGSDPYMRRARIIDVSETYRKIPKISPGAYIFQTPFLRGLFLEGLIFGGC